VVLSTLVVPLPEELALLWAGWISHGNLPVVLASIAAFLGVMVGDAASYLLGRTVLPKFLETRLGKRMVNRKMRKWGEDFVKRHGFRAVLLGRFLVGLRGPVYLAIGAAKFSAAKFFAINAAVGAVEVSIVVGLGYYCAAACANGPSSRPSADRNQAAQQQGGLGIPVQYEKLSNGLKVVLSPDHTSPVAVVGVYYGIGFRIEPRDRTGFAHLFEHMMFQ